jgi:hypothetical protein
MQSECGGAVRRLEFPAGEMALHDLEPRRHPLDRREHRQGVVGRRNRSGELEHDFRLDARLGEALQFQGCHPSGREMDGVRPDMRPHRLVDAIARPDRAVSEPDLAADPHPALFDPAPLDLAIRRVATSARLVAVSGGISGIVVRAIRRFAMAPRSGGVAIS